MIHILTTGGTIEGLDHDRKENKPENVNISIQDFLNSANVLSRYSIENVFKKDSRLISQEDLEHLVERIKATNATKILITHGTFTMENTAEYIGNRNPNKTIVLVGSFISGISANTDARFNLGYAIGSLQFLIPDVYVAMNGNIFHWSNITKNLEANRFERKYEQ